MCKALVLLAHTFHCVQGQICSWMPAQRPCQKQWMCTYAFKKKRLWLTDGKVFVVAWFSAKASFQGHREPPCCHTTKGERFPRPHARPVETLEDSLGRTGRLCTKLQEKGLISFFLCFSATETALFGDVTCSHTRGPLLRAWHLVHRPK